MNSPSLRSYPLDGYQRVSYCRSASKRRIRNEGDNDVGDGVIICKNLVLGCKPEEADDFRPFVFEPTWCVYIKALDNVDMGRYVKRVTFRMSPRLPLRLHVADSSPFEITEVLSTDFPLELQVDYHDPSMSPTTYMYKPNDVFDGKYNVDLRMNFQGHERKDKMFFMNPSPDMQLTLSTPGPSSTLASKMMRLKSRQQKLLQHQQQQQQQQLQQQQQQRQQEQWHLRSSLPYDELSDKLARRQIGTAVAAEEAGAQAEPGVPSVPRPIFNVRLPSLPEVGPDKL